MLKTCGIAVLLVLLAAPVAWASPEPAAGAAADAPAAKAAEAYPISKALAIIGVCFGAAACATAGGVGIAKIGGKCIEAMARQPEASGTMFAPMVVAAAMVEGLVLFAIVVCLLAVLLRI